MSKLIIEGNEIKTAYDLYELYNEWVQDIMDDAKQSGYDYDCNQEPNWTIEEVRDNYQEIFEKIPKRNYKTAESFEQKCMAMGLLKGLVIFG